MKDKNNILVIIDADSLAFMCSKSTLEESINILDEKLQNIFYKTEATHYVIFISKGKYFRHNVDPLYKSNRAKYPTQLKWIKTLKSYLEENYNAQWMDGVEADDLVAYWYNKNLIYFNNGSFDDYGVEDDEFLVESKISTFKFELILCSPDKDLLQSIPGNHFNYTYQLTGEAKESKKDNPEYVIKEDDIIKGWWVETNEVDAYKFQWIQVLMGDAGDSIKGLSGVGIKTAQKWLENIKFLPEEVLSRYIAYYRDVSKAIYEYQKSYRLLHLLENDEDFMREVGKLPDFPIITEINKETDEKPIEF